MGEFYTCKLIRRTVQLPSFSTGNTGNTAENQDWLDEFLRKKVFVHAGWTKDTCNTALTWIGKYSRGPYNRLCRTCGLTLDEEDSLWTIGDGTVPAISQLGLKLANPTVNHVLWQYGAVDEKQYAPEYQGYTCSESDHQGVLNCDNMLRYLSFRGSHQAAAPYPNPRFDLPQADPTGRWQMPDNSELDANRAPDAAEYQWCWAEGSWKVVSNQWSAKMNRQELINDIERYGLQGEKYMNSPIRVWSSIGGNRGLIANVKNAVTDGRVHEREFPSILNFLAIHNNANVRHPNDVTREGGRRHR